MKVRVFRLDGQVMDVSGIDTVVLTRKAIESSTQPVHRLVLVADNILGYSIRPDDEIKKDRHD